MKQTLRAHQPGRANRHDGAKDSELCMSSHTSGDDLTDDSGVNPKLSRRRKAWGALIERLGVNGGMEDSSFSNESKDGGAFNPIGDSYTHVNPPNPTSRESSCGAYTNPTTKQLSRRGAFRRPINTSSECENDGSNKQVEEQESEASLAGIDRTVSVTSTGAKISSEASSAASTPLDVPKMSLAENTRDKNGEGSSFRLVAVAKPERVLIEHSYDANEMSGEICTPSSAMYEAALAQSEGNAQTGGDWPKDTLCSSFVDNLGPGSSLEAESSNRSACLGKETEKDDQDGSVVGAIPITPVRPSTIDNFDRDKGGKSLKARSQHLAAPNTTDGLSDPTSLLIGVTSERNSTGTIRNAEGDFSLEVPDERRSRQQETEEGDPEIASIDKIGAPGDSDDNTEDGRPSIKEKEREMESGENGTKANAMRDIGWTASTLSSLALGGAALAAAAYCKRDDLRELRRKFFG